MKRSLSKPEKGFIGLIAGICALGTGMLVAATVISTPASLLLLFASGFMVNYSSPLIYRWLSRKFIASELDNRENQKNYLMKVLKSDHDLETIDSVHARNMSLKQNFWIGAASLTISLALATCVYFLAALIPAVGLLYSITALMFTSLAIITAMNFYGGMTDVWRSITDYFFDHSSTTSSHVFSRSQKLFLFICVLSCVAAGLLAGAITRQGVQTTMPSLLPAIAASGGPLGWLVLTAMVLAVFSMMGYEIFKMMKSGELKKKLTMIGSFFSPKQYVLDLKTEWKTINQDIKNKKKELLTCTDEGEKERICREMDELYRQKDTVYHRFNVYQQKGFFTLYAVVTAVVFTLSLGGMLMHLARNYQSFHQMLPKLLGVSARVSTAIATGIMYLAMLSETIFTGTIVTSTMNEEALLGSQTKQYEDQLSKQQKKSEKVEGYFFLTSRLMHGIFETFLGLFGASGHVAETNTDVSAYHEPGMEGKTGQAFADYKPMTNVLSLGMGIRAGLERHDVEMSSLHFMYKNKTAGISRVAPKNFCRGESGPVLGSIRPFSP